MLPAARSLDPYDLSVLIILLGGPYSAATVLVLRRHGRHIHP
ncbi:hypothetical protein [Streptomyces sp. NBC_00996]|nr:hypothetical protein OG390_40635 [Streptomyces sp. NBC_00996]